MLAKIFLFSLFCIFFFGNADTPKQAPIRIVISATEPFYFKEKQNGFEYEIAQKVSDFLDRELLIIPTNSTEELFEKLEKGEADIALGVSTSIQRGKKNIYFTDPYIETTFGAIVDKYSIPQDPEGNVIPMSYFNSIYDLKNVSGLSFSVRKSSSSFSFLEKEFPNFPIYPYEDDTEALKSLESDMVDAFVTDSLYLEYLLKLKPNLKSKYKVLLKPTYKKSICMVVHKKLPIELVYRLNFLIKELINTKEIQNLKSKYFN